MNCATLAPPSAQSPQLVTATAQDWPKLRDLRLEMLADTPLAFGESAADAALLSDQDWQARWAGLDPERVATFALSDQDRFVGQVQVLLDGFSRPARVWLGNLYLSPGLRGGSWSSLLMEQAEQWARRRGVGAVHLEVHQHNARALALYARRGYVATGASRPHPLDRDGGLELELAKPLG